MRNTCLSKIDKLGFARHGENTKGSFRQDKGKVPNRMEQERIAGEGKIIVSGRERSILHMRKAVATKRLT